MMFIILFFLSFLFVPFAEAQTSNQLVLEVKSFVLDDGISPVLRIFQDNQAFGDFVIPFSSGEYITQTLSLTNPIEVKRGIAFYLTNGKQTENGFRGVYIDKIKLEDKWIEAEDKRVRYIFQRQVQPQKPIIQDGERKVFSLTKSSSLTIIAEDKCSFDFWNQPKEIKEEFPKIGILHFPGINAKRDEQQDPRTIIDPKYRGWQAKNFDLYITSTEIHYDQFFDIEYLKRTNPQMLILGTLASYKAMLNCVPWPDNPSPSPGSFCYDFFYKEIPPPAEDKNDWFKRLDNGQIEIEVWPNGSVVSLNKKVSCPTYNGWRWLDFFNFMLKSRLCQKIWDGFFLDELNWENEEEKQGIIKMLSDFRNETESFNYILLGNIWNRNINFDTKFLYPYLNGRYFEEANIEGDVWQNLLHDYIRWSYKDQNSKTLPVWNFSALNLPVMENLNLFRFAFGLALLGNGYFIMDQSEGGWGHNKIYWLDEFSVNPQTAKATAVKTQTTKSISASETNSLEVVSTQGFEEEGNIYVDSEFIYYGRKDDTHFYDLVRGLNRWYTDKYDTAKAKNHQQGASVYQGFGFYKNYLGRALNEAYGFYTNKNITAMVNDGDDLKNRVLVREFENGLVLVNTHKDQERTISNLSRGGELKWQKIIGVQDPTINNGQRNIDSLTIPPLTAIILLKQKTADIALLKQILLNFNNPSSLSEYDLNKDSKINVFDYSLGVVD